MSALILDEAQVTEHLPMAECIEAMAAVLAARARGEASMPLRQIVRGPGAAGLLGLMPGYRGGEQRTYSLKAVCVFPGNPRVGLNAHQGIVALFDGETGRPTAILNGSAVTAIRTAAVTALATRVLARAGARSLAMIGSGVQARAHVESLLAVREFERVAIFSPTAANAQRLASESRERFAGGPAFAVARSAREALEGADVVVLATSSATPVIERAWLADGAHVNAIGSSVVSAHELDVETLAAAELFVDARESLENEAGEYRLALEQGLLGPDHVVSELGEVLIGERPGRSGDGALTLFRSLGIAVEDLAAGELAVARARAAGAGVEAEL